VKTAVLLIGCIISGASGNLLLKSGMNTVGSPSAAGLSLVRWIMAVFMTPHILGGVVLYVVSFVIWLAILSMMDISKAYPLFVAGSFLIVMGIGATLLSEHLTPLRIVAGVLILAGVIVGSQT
jgi:multidrug transporter EmrE-like cation transporter